VAISWIAWQPETGWPKLRPCSSPMEQRKNASGDPFTESVNSVKGPSFDFGCRVRSACAVLAAVCTARGRTHRCTPRCRRSGRNLRDHQEVIRSRVERLQRLRQRKPQKVLLRDEVIDSADVAAIVDGRQPAVAKHEVVPGIKTVQLRTGEHMPLPTRRRMRTRSAKRLSCSSRAPVCTSKSPAAFPLSRTAVSVNFPEMSLMQAESSTTLCWLE
jgi:hypothetical protein